MFNDKNTIINKITHDIINFKALTNQQITSLLNLTEKEKDDILLLYNEIVKTYAEYLNEDHK